MSIKYNISTKKRERRRRRKMKSERDKWVNGCYWEMKSFSGAMGWGIKRVGGIEGAWTKWK